MSQVQFYCPDCAFSREISKSDIPSTASQCRCPSCRKLLDLHEAIKPIVNKSRDEEPDEVSQRVVDQGGVSKEKYHDLLEEALSSLNAGSDFEAMHLLEEVEKLSSTPKVRSYLAYCRAKVKQEYSDAIRVCLDALKEEPRVADHYLNLGRIYILVNKRGPALQTLRKGLKLGPHPQLMQILRGFEMRKPPVISTLPRDHFLNQKLGKLLSRLGLR